MNRRYAALGGVALALALALGSVGAIRAGIGSAHAAPAAKAHKSIAITETNNKYGFATVKATVKAGTKVTWTNKTDAPHTVTGTGGWKFSSRTFTQNQSVSFVFKKAGTYHYFCSIHPYMKGTVVVTK